MRIYVETVIRASPEEVWRRTQHPGEHARWDARFTSIRYERGRAGRFRYSTRILPGLTIHGTGTGTGTGIGARGGPGGRCTSALVFASGHPLSLIRSGSGYWRYVPAEGGVRFATGYDYTVRWGRAGRLGTACSGRSSAGPPPGRSSGCGSGSRPAPRPKAPPGAPCSTRSPRRERRRPPFPAPAGAGAPPSTRRSHDLDLRTRTRERLRPPAP